MHHAHVFDGLARSFIGSYTVEIQNIWQGINLGAAAPAAGGNETPSSSRSRPKDIPFSLVNSARFGVQHNWELSQVPALQVHAGLSRNSTTYFFPKGISPFHDPIHVDILSWDFDGQLVWQNAWDVGEAARAGYQLGAGATLAFSQAHLHSSFFDVRFADPTINPYIASSIFLDREFGRLNLDLRWQSDANFELSARQTISW